MSKHTNETTVCDACEKKLLQAHPDIASWFRETVKTRFGDAHISWSFRDEASQDQCFAEGKSKLPWPMSAHNKSDDQGNPSSLALDLFRLCSNGMASWEWRFFKAIADESEENKSPIVWGGVWKTILDSDHYQMSSFGSGSST